MTTLTLDIETPDAPPTAPADPPAPAETDDRPAPAAPYGYKRDGTPRRRPVSPNLRPFQRGNPGRPTGTGRTGRDRAGANPPGAPRSRPAAAPGRPRGRVDYAKPLKGLGQLLALPLSFRPQTQPDAIAITVHWPAIADALDETAQAQPQLAAVLDRVVKAGPYGALITAVVPLLAQLAVNHGLPVDFGRQLGAVSPQLLMARAMRDSAKDAAKASAGAAAEEAELRAIAAEMGWEIQEAPAAA